MVELAALDDADVELLQRLIREHEEKTVSPRAPGHPGAVGSSSCRCSGRWRPKGAEAGGRDAGGLSADADRAGSPELVRERSA